MRFRQRKWALATAIVAVLLVVAWLLVFRAPSAPSTHAAAGVQGAAAKSMVASGTPASRASSAPAPAAASGTSIFFALPPIKTPLKAMYADLRAQAAAGNPRASCRLAFELQRCASLPSQRTSTAKYAEHLGTRLQAETEARRRAFFEDEQERNLRNLEVAEAACAGFAPGKDERQPWEYVLAAARSGHQPSAVRYVMGGTIGLDHEHPLQTFDGWSIYRNEAPAMAERLVAAGVPEAYEWLAFSSMPGWLGVGFTPQDPVRAAALFMALRERAAPRYVPQLDRMIATLSEREKLTPADLLRAKGMSMDLAKQIKAPADGVDFSQGTLGYDDGSHCAQ